MASGFAVPFTRIYADSFDDISSSIDEMFDEVDASIEQQYEQIDKAMEQAYKELEAEIAGVWGFDDIKLPSKKQWVDYSEDRRVRREFDFQRGVLRVEAVVPRGKPVETVVSRLKQAVAKAVTDTEQSLADNDAALKKAVTKLQAEGVVLEKETSKANNKPVLSGIVDKKQTESVVKKGPVKQVSKESNKTVLKYEIPFTGGYYSKLAKRYAAPVLEYAKQHDVPASVVLAVMQTESAFNPRATSHIPAYGLMQLVPRSGAMDSYRHLYGEKKLLGPDYLYTPEKNIELGAGYLSLVYKKYLSRIEHSDSRWYCTIAAYNTGAGNVAKAFGHKRVSKAAAVINQMAPNEVFKQLQNKLPYDETKHYVTKVTKARKHYAEWDSV